MKLYGYWRSSSSWRVRIALAHKGLSYDYVAVHLRRGDQLEDDYAVLNPQRQVPLLELEVGGAIHRVSQSMAILELLEELHPSPPLLPAEPFARARARQLAETVNAGIQPLQNLGVLGWVKSTLGGDPAEWARHWIERGLEGLERTAAESAGTFLVGDAVSVADVCLVPQLYNARRFGVSVAGFPTLTRVEAACLALDAFLVSHPDRQIDAEAP